MFFTFLYAQFMMQCIGMLVSKWSRSEQLGIWIVPKPMLLVLAFLFNSILIFSKGCWHFSIDCVVFPQTQHHKLIMLSNFSIFISNTNFLPVSLLDILEYFESSSDAEDFLYSISLTLASVQTFITQFLEKYKTFLAGWRVFWLKFLFFLN